ncbi:two component AraC family transcriptional regulator [gut metagenome]|uniref:Two component AraC family transcriptional regulator n=1 Tax=gut metagenome TaxID=749906 RepID=J9GKY6_9ZZZZ
MEVHDLCNRLALELRAKNKVAALELLKKAASLLKITPHLRREGIHCCSELYSICSMVLAPMSSEPNGFFVDTSSILADIQSLSTRSQVLDWMIMLGRQVDMQLDVLGSRYSDPLERARQYVRTHVDERILLQDAASAAGLSPSYLSALFKKEYNQNFMDFVNETKMNRACQLIREGRYRIYEISYMLGFENAYYFTRVFRRHVGMTPTEYQRKLHPEA